VITVITAMAVAAPKSASKAKPVPAAKPAATPAAPKTAQQARDEKLYKAVTAAWSQFYANKPKDAGATVEFDELFPPAGGIHRLWLIGERK